jgi:hypothetical protein
MKYNPVDEARDSPGGIALRFSLRQGQLIPVRHDSAPVGLKQNDSARPRNNVRETTASRDSAVPRSVRQDKDTWPVRQFQQQASGILSPLWGSLGWGGRSPGAALRRPRARGLALLWSTEALSIRELLPSLLRNEVAVIIPDRFAGVPSERVPRGAHCVSRRMEWVQRTLLMGRTLTATPPSHNIHFLET